MATLPLGTSYEDVESTLQAIATGERGLFSAEACCLLVTLGLAEELPEEAASKPLPRPVHATGNQVLDLVFGGLEMWADASAKFAKEHTRYRLTTQGMKAYSERFVFEDLERLRSIVGPRLASRCDLIRAMTPELVGRGWVGVDGLESYLNATLRTRVYSWHVERFVALLNRYGLLEVDQDAWDPKTKRVRFGVPATGSGRLETVTGWSRVDQAVYLAQRRLDQADSVQEYQEVGLLCRETAISLAQAVYDARRHPTADGVPPSDTDAKRMLEAFVMAELDGHRNEALRRLMRSVVDVANKLQHDREADRRLARLCMEATTAAVRMIAVLSGMSDL